MANWVLRLMARFARPDCGVKADGQTNLTDSQFVSQLRRFITMRCVVRSGLLLFALCLPTLLALHWLTALLQQRDARRPAGGGMGIGASLAAVFGMLADGYTWLFVVSQLLALTLQAGLLESVLGMEPLLLDVDHQGSLRAVKTHWAKWLRLLRRPTLLLLAGCIGAMTALGFIGASGALANALGAGEGPATYPSEWYTCAAAAGGALHTLVECFWCARDSIAFPPVQRRVRVRLRGLVGTAVLSALRLTLKTLIAWACLKPVLLLVLYELWRSFFTDDVTGWQLRSLEPLLKRAQTVLEQAGAAYREWPFGAHHAADQGSGGDGRAELAQLLCLCACLFLLTASRDLLLLFFTVPLRFRGFPAGDDSDSNNYDEDSEPERSEWAVLVRTLKAARNSKEHLVTNVAMVRLEVLAERCPTQRVLELFEARPGHRDQLWQDLFEVCLGDAKKAGKDEALKKKADAKYATSHGITNVPSSIPFSAAKGLLDTLTAHVTRLNNGQNPTGRPEGIPMILWDGMSNYYGNTMFMEDVFGDQQLHVRAVRVIGSLLYAARQLQEDRYGLSIHTKMPKVAQDPQYDRPKPGTERYHVVRVLDLMLGCHSELSKLVDTQAERATQRTRDAACVVLHELHSAIFRLVGSYRDLLRPYDDRYLPPDGDDKAWAAAQRNESYLPVSSENVRALRFFLDYSV